MQKWGAGQDSSAQGNEFSFRRQVPIGWGDAHNLQMEAVSMVLPLSRVQEGLRITLTNA